MAAGLTIKAGQQNPVDVAIKDSVEVIFTYVVVVRSGVIMYGGAHAVRGWRAATARLQR